MPFSFPRCEVIPLPDRQFSFRIDGREVTRWHASERSPRPFYYPISGPDSGESLTRMGHPGAPDHDHHQSVWFAHHKLGGHDFWSISSKNRVVQTEWIAIEDGDDEALFATQLEWRLADGTALVNHELITAVLPGAEKGEWFLETQSTFRPAGPGMVTAEQSNFGFFAVRVAKTISSHFGGGEITSSEGGRGEKEIFGQFARWMDYSGPMRGAPEDEGLTLFDHPSNPHSPAHWHVRKDGWMGPSACRNDAIPITQDRPLVLRYLLHIHRGAANPERSEAVAADYARMPGFVFAKDPPANQHMRVQRAAPSPSL